MREGRTTVYNNITSPEKLAQVNPENINLHKDFVDYLRSIGRAGSTIEQYISNLNIFWCWNLEFNQNKYFIDLTKRDVVKLQNHCINEFHWSPKRIRTFKATLSSLSNYIENVLDDEYPTYRSIINKIESPPNDMVREKTIFKLEELRPLLDYLVEHEEYMKACILSLGINSGRRKSELTRFKSSYFSDDNLLFDGALYKTPEKIKTKGRGTKGKMLEVYTLAKPFKPYLDLWMKQREKLGIKSEWLFPKCENGKWIDEHISSNTLDSYAKTFSNILKRNFYWHALRHAWTSYMLDQNLPESVVQSIQGWSTRDMVSVYDDRPMDSTLEQYFGAGGIKGAEKKSLIDL